MDSINVALNVADCMSNKCASFNASELIVALCIVY